MAGEGSMSHGIAAVRRVLHLRPWARPLAFPCWAHRVPIIASTTTWYAHRMPSRIGVSRCAP